MLFLIYKIEILFYPNLSIYVYVKLLCEVTITLKVCGGQIIYFKQEKS